MTHITNINEAGLAIQGYDPISYFSGTPTPGQADLTSTHSGATYQFANAENKAAFDADPEKYIPQYGGFCAVAMAEGKAVPVNPNTFQITDGKLYLFYNGKNGNTLPQWEAELQTRKTDADKRYENGDFNVVIFTNEY